VIERPQQYQLAGRAESRNCPLLARLAGLDFTSGRMVGSTPASWIGSVRHAGPECCNAANSVLDHPRGRWRNFADMRGHAGKITLDQNSWHGCGGFRARQSAIANNLH
jgi:hypothetical protein